MILKSSTNSLKFPPPSRRVGIRNISDYSPFGVLLPERTIETANFRRGFQGQEVDSEIKGEGNSYDFGARMLDPRVGRWFSMDPVSQPSVSPYNSFENNAVAYADPDGRNGIARIVGDKVVVTMDYYFYGPGVDNAKAEQIASTIQSAWNDANGQVTIDGQVYSVEFQVCGKAIAGPEEAVQRLTNAAFEDNFIAIADDNRRYPNNSSDPEKNGKLVNSSHTNGKSGWWNEAQEKESGGTTYSHEPIHGMGMDGHPDLEKSGNLSIVEGNIDANGNIAIRLPSNTKIDGVLIDPSKRVVMQSDIDMLQLEEAITKNNGQLQPAKFVGEGVNIFNVDGSLYKSIENSEIKGNGTPEGQ